MQETLRVFAQEQLAARGATAALGDAHAQYYVALGRRMEQGCLSSNQRFWLTMWEHEQYNFRAALAWLHAHYFVEQGLSLTCSLEYIWIRYGRIAEGRSWLERFLATDQNQVDVGIRARGLNILSGYLEDQGEFSDVIPITEQALQLARLAGDLRTESELLQNLALFASYKGEMARAFELQEHSIALISNIDEPWYLINRLASMGRMKMYAHQYQEAAVLYEEA